MRGQPFFLTVGLILGLFATPTAIAPGWSDEFQDWRDCIIDHLTDPCIELMMRFIEAFRREYEPWCAEPNPDAVPNEPFNAVKFHEC